MSTLIKDQSELIAFAGLIRESVDGDHSCPQINDVDQFIQRLDYHGISLLALHANRLPQKVAQQLKSRTALAIANETLKQKALIELFEGFAATGLTDNCLFKGSALAYSVYSQAWLRPRSDSDLFISAANKLEYERVFATLGYKKLFAIEGDYVSYQSTFGKKLLGQSYINIDLHWRINNRQILADSYSIESLLSDSQRLTKLSPVIKIPSSVDSLIIASLHRLGHHHNEERLTWLHDIHLLASSLTPQQWSTLIDRTQEKKLSAITLDALKTSEQLFGTNIPRENAQQMEIAALQAEPSQLFLHRDLPEWRYFLHDVKALKSWRERINVTLEHLIPKPVYVRTQMGTNSALVGYVTRFWRGVRRIFTR